MKTKTRNVMLSTIYNFGSFDTNDIRAAVGRTYRDASHGRFVRRLVENGYTKRTKYGFSLTSRGRKMIERAVS